MTNHTKVNTTKSGTNIIVLKPITFKPTKPTKSNTRIPSEFKQESELSIFIYNLAVGIWIVLLMTFCISFGVYLFTDVARFEWLGVIFGIVFGGVIGLTLLGW